MQPLNSAEIFFTYFFDRHKNWLYAEIKQQVVADIYLAPYVSVFNLFDKL